MSTNLVLIIGSRNTSSWSLRPWLAMTYAGIEFEEQIVALRTLDTARELARLSPSGKVPVLRVDGTAIWESLAICEFVAELTGRLWPEDPSERALARSIACEMHAGFQDLRAFMPMDFVSRFTPAGMMLSGVERDIARVCEIWRTCLGRQEGRGRFLFGSFSIADAMFAPVASRFATYGVPLDDICADYVATLLSLPEMEEWFRGALSEVAGKADHVAASPRALLEGFGSRRQSSDPRSASSGAKEDAAPTRTLPQSRIVAGNSRPSPASAEAGQFSMLGRTRMRPPASRMDGEQELPVPSLSSESVMPAGEDRIAPQDGLIPRADVESVLRDGSRPASGETASSAAIIPPSDDSPSDDALPDDAPPAASAEISSATPMDEVETAAPDFRAVEEPARLRPEGPSWPEAAALSAGAGPDAPGEGVTSDESADAGEEGPDGSGALSDDYARWKTKRPGSLDPPSGNAGGDEPAGAPPDRGSDGNDRLIRPAGNEPRGERLQPSLPGRAPQEGPAIKPIGAGIRRRH